MNKIYLITLFFCVTLVQSDDPLNWRTGPIKCYVGIGNGVMTEQHCPLYSVGCQKMKIGLW
jgi:hypothetical protein